ncbi:MAG: hypothetical protein AB7U43_13495, partial [Desulfobacter sp.]
MRSIREAKADNALGIRSFGSWKVYRYESHRFITFMAGKRRSSILNTASIYDDMAVYLEERLAHYVEKKRSRQTMETILSALGKFEYAVNYYIEVHALDIPRMNTEQLRMDFYARSRKLLRKSSKLF